MCALKSLDYRVNCLSKCNCEKKRQISSEQDFAWSWYFTQTCNLQAEFVYILSAQSRQTNSACRL